MVNQEILNCLSKNMPNVSTIDEALTWLEKNKNYYIETQMYIIKDTKSAYFNHKAYKVIVKGIKDKKVIILLEKEMFPDKHKAIIFAINEIYKPNFDKSFFSKTAENIFQDKAEKFLSFLKNFS